MIHLRNKIYTCPVDVTLSFVGGKWKLLILAHLYWARQKSYSDIKDNLPGISEKMLSQQLKELEKDGLIKKQIVTHKPYRVMYLLTPQGKEFTPLYKFASKWGINYLQANGIEYVQDQHLYK